ncbi:phosphoribosyltransferase family protein [Faecalimicrobium sp. JNUCC 81]
MSCLKFNCDINITDNPLDLNIEDYLEIAVRNNPKRRFLFVSKVLGKHLACKADDMDGAGRLIVKAYKKKNINGNNGTVISFAETGTAIGHSVFNYLEGDYEFIHTTREIVDGYKSLEFLEEHSHATDHNLYFENLETLKNGDEVFLVDDEITTAKTCVNIIRKIQSMYPKKRYTICSILNWVDDVNIERIKCVEEELDCKIDFVYLFKGKFDFVIDSIPVLNEDTELKDINREIKVNFINLDMDAYINDNKYIKYTGRFGINKKEQEKLVQVVKRESYKLKIENKNSDVLYLGTEEFMYIPMLFAKESKGRVYYHSTTRSPIIEIEKDEYPINSKFEIESFYNKGIKNYVYNLDKKNYSECFLFVESKKDENEFNDIINTFKHTSINKLNIVSCSSV